jgi:hypothetical protein
VDFAGGAIGKHVPDLHAPVSRESGAQRCAVNGRVDLEERNFSGHQRF